MRKEDKAMKAKVRKSKKLEVVKFSNPKPFQFYTPWTEPSEYHTKIYPNIPEGSKLKHVEIRNYEKSDFFRIRFCYLEEKKR